ncbi:hypothetical protein N7457_007821 [Penicillium paradoxum]|uniref:uncharacterized protein n=1 Tax=Penicillium paradoxum TaxID=176176 RepID=UPI00254757EF|nr:uncharacterized protein N7457_007821 [Penicillium paradoxum]KAJ5772925.1 hypothetical protein N7457_007821 [Penicillium paradoxum]
MAPQDFQLWEKCGISPKHISQVQVEKMIHEVYVPIINKHIRSGKRAEHLFAAQRESIYTGFVRIVSQLPPSVLAHVPNQMEVVLYMYDRLKYIRHNDPAWMKIMSEPAA